MLIEIESTREGGCEVQKISNGKQIKLDGRLLAWSFHAELRWAALAMGRYSLEQRDQVVGFATAWELLMLPRRALRIGSFNCGRTGGSAAATLSIVEGVFENWNWDVLWLCELDCVHGGIDHTEELADFWRQNCVLRHYGGPGNTAYVFLIRCHVEQLVCKTLWLERSARLVLKGSGCKTLSIVGIHRVLGDADATPSQIALHVDNNQEADSQIVIVGDWNIDMSWEVPNQVLDSVQPDHVKDIIDQLEFACVAWDCCVSLPTMNVMCPSGPFDAECLFHLYTRFPTGQLVLWHTPSLLDFVVLSHDSLVDHWMSWAQVPADHAAVGYTINWSWTRQPKVKTHWVCRDEDACLQWIEDQFVVVSDSQMHEYARMSVSSLKVFCRNTMNQFACNRSVADRRHARLPQHIWSLYGQIAETVSEDDRRKLQKAVFIAKKAVWTRANERHCMSQVARGKVMRKTSKLFQIKGVECEGHIYEGIEGAELVVAKFRSLWRSDHIHNLSLLNDFRVQSDCTDINIYESELCDVWHKMSNLGKWEVMACVLALLNSFGNCSLNSFARSCLI